MTLLPPAHPQYAHHHDTGLRMSVVACGRFHYHKYLANLDALGVLAQFHYSYRRNYRFPSVSPGRLRNHWLKEYAMYAGLRVIGRGLTDRSIHHLHRLWETQVLRDWENVDAAVLLLHGTAPRLVEHCRRRGTKVILEAVNVHPTRQDALLEAEYARRGSCYRVNPIVRERMLAEIECADHILCPSRIVARSFIESGVSANRVSVLPYALDSSLPHVVRGKGRLPNVPLRIVCVAQVTFRKGQVYLLEAVQKLRSSLGPHSVEVTLVGALDPEYEPALRAHQGAFRHIRHVPNELIHDVYLNADVLVLPSIEDGFGVVVSEALSAGLPAIVTDQCGSADLIRDGQNGWIVQAASSDGLAAALERVRSGPPVGMERPPSSDWMAYSRGLVQIVSGQRRVQTQARVLG